MTDMLNFKGNKTRLTRCMSLSTLKTLALKSSPERLNQSPSATLITSC